MAAEQMEQQEQGLPDPADLAQDLVDQDPSYAQAVAESIAALLSDDSEGQEQEQQEGPPPSAERPRGYVVTPGRGRIAPGGR